MTVTLFSKVTVDLFSECHFSKWWRWIWNSGEWRWIALTTRESWRKIARPLEPDFPDDGGFRGLEVETFSHFSSFFHKVKRNPSLAPWNHFSMKTLKSPNISKKSDRKSSPPWNRSWWNYLHQNIIIIRHCRELEAGTATRGSAVAQTACWAEEGGAFDAHHFSLFLDFRTFRVFHFTYG